MAISLIGKVFQDLRCSLQTQADPLNDAQLLNRFIEHSDEPSFATIVRRHGSMVMGVCRRLIQNPHDAEDAFQATFLVLARKAASIAKRELLANWLYGVAFKTALKARAINMRRRTKEKQLAALPDLAAGEPAVMGDELLARLDRELSRVPEKYRVPILLCDFEGMTRKQAAALLHCPEGSLSSRLARAKAMLARRLVRNGAMVSGASLAAVLQDAASAGVPSRVFASTTKSVALQVAGGVAARAISPKIVTLVERRVRLTDFRLRSIGQRSLRSRSTPRPNRHATSVAFASRSRPLRSDGGGGRH